MLNPYEIHEINLQYAGITYLAIDEENILFSRSKDLPTKRKWEKTEPNLVLNKAFYLVIIAPKTKQSHRQKFHRRCGFYLSLGKSAFAYQICSYSHASAEHWPHMQCFLRLCGCASVCQTPHMQPFPWMVLFASAMTPLAPACTHLQPTPPQVRWHQTSAVFINQQAQKWS